MLHRQNRLAVYALLFISAVLLLPNFARPAHAAYLAGRSVALRNPIAASVTSYTFRFNIASELSVGSIQFEFCDNTPFIGTPCTLPPGIVVNNAVLSAQSGETGFSVSPSSTSNNLVIGRTAVLAAAAPVSYTFDAITNPSNPNKSTYVRISTYASDDASGPVIDQGSVVFSTSGRFGTAAFVPPHLYFCVGVTVASDCSTMAGNYVDFGEFSPTSTRAVTTQFAAATNDPTGYYIFSLGTTLTSGNNTISPQASPFPSQINSSQYGINLRDNNNPNSGQNMSGAGTGTPMPNYNTPDLYMFETGAAVARANSSTDYNRYTTTYIANIPSNQPVGVYSTTITYMAVAQF